MAVQPRPFRLADYYALKQILEVAVSPDGSRAAFVVQGYRKHKNDRYQNLWLVQTDGQAPPHRLTRGKSDDSAPAFSPDGRWLAFLSTRPHEPDVAAELAETAAGEKAAGDKDEEKKPRAQIWLLDLLMGGEPRQLTHREEGVTAFSWAPDGERIVFASRDPTPAQQQYLKSIQDDADKGPLVFRRTLHKQDEVGYLDDVRSHLFVASVATRAVQRLTDGPCDETEPRWSPDGRWIAFLSNRTGDPDSNMRTDVWLIRSDGSEARRLTHGDVAAQWPRWSPDGQRVAFLSTLEPENTYRVSHLLCVEAAAAEPVRDLAACVGEGFASIGGVVPDPAAGDPIAHARVYPVPLKATPCTVLTRDLDRHLMGPPVWLDGETLLVPAADRAQTRLARCTLTGEAALVYPADHDRLCTTEAMDAAGGTVVAIVNRPETAADLFALRAADLAFGAGRAAASGAGAPAAVRLTAMNADLFAQRTPARYERVEYRNSDGGLVEALVVIPPGWEPARGKAPLLAVIHGGPMWHDQPEFRFDRQYLASQGYLILMPQYRGSIGYGEAFCMAIRSAWGPMEHDDLMSGVDHLIRLGWADPDRLFCTGFSYGGIMTNWAVGHTDRFRAAASEHGVWDYVSAFGTDDCQLWWQDDLGLPWQNAALYRQTSPMSGLANIKTPLLITAGDQDWRCAPSQGEQLYVALRKKGVPTELVLYQGEHHAVTRPRRAIDRIRRISAWLARFGGQPLADESAEGYPDQV